MNQIYREMNNKMIGSAMNNPQLKQVMDLVKNSGKSPRELFFQKAKEMGVDPNTIINQLR